MLVDISGCLFVGRRYPTTFSTLVTLYWAKCVHRPLPLPTRAGSRSHSASTDQCAVSPDFPLTCCVLSSFLNTRLSTASWPLTLVEPISELVLWKSLFLSAYDCHFITVIYQMLQLQCGAISDCESKKCPVFHMLKVLSILRHDFVTAGSDDGRIFPDLLSICQSYGQEYNDTFYDSQLSMVGVFFATL